MLPCREYLPTIPLECAFFTYRQVDNPYVDRNSRPYDHGLLKTMVYLNVVCLTLRIQATLPHPRGIFKESNPIRISGYLRIVLLIRRVDIILVSKRIPNHQVTTTIYYSWWRFLDFLGLFNPFISPGDLYTLGPIPPSLPRSLAVAPKAVGPTKPKRRQAVGPREAKAFNKGAQRCCKVAKGPPSSSHWAPWKGKKSSTPNPLGPWSWGAGPDETCWKHKHQKQKNCWN